MPAAASQMHTAELLSVERPVERPAKGLKLLPEDAPDALKRVYEDFECDDGPYA